MWTLCVEAGHLYGTGCNTDGQLSLSSTSDHYSLTRIPLSPLLTTQEGGILKILSGGDTSGLITKSGKLYTWGNSEYGQGGHGKVLDRVTEMVEAVGAREVVLREGGRRIVDYQCGGSFGVVLDGEYLFSLSLSFSFSGWLSPQGRERGKKGHNEGEK